MDIIKKTTVLIIAVLLVLPAGCGGTDLSYQNVDSETAYDMLNTRDVLFLDVRTPKEHNQARIQPSVLIPVQILNTDYTKIADHKDKKILIYCRSGNRSVTASKILLNNGFKHLYNLKGGIKDWAKHQYPVQTGH